MNDKSYVSAPQSGQYWHHTIGPKGKKVQLLTIGGVCVIGQWSGQLARTTKPGLRYYANIMWSIYASALSLYAMNSKKFLFAS